MDDAAVTALREGIRGTVTDRGRPGYDEARKVRNGMIDRRPAVIVQPVNAGDVMTAVRFAAENDLTVAVRGGGAQRPGLRHLRRRRGRRPVGHARRPGRPADPHRPGRGRRDLGRPERRGLPVRTGHDRRHHLDHRRRRPDPGRRHRLPRARARALAATTCSSADVVTGDGSFHVASDKDDADLFWAIRGGGGNFGVVTSFEFRLSPVKDIYGGPMFFELDQAGDLLPVLPRVHRRRARGSSAASRRTRSRRRCRSSRRTATASRSSRSW